jgi:hypothetical protein
MTLQGMQPASFHPQRILMTEYAPLNSLLSIVLFSLVLISCRHIRIDPVILALL